MRRRCGILGMWSNDRAGGAPRSRWRAIRAWIVILLAVPAWEIARRVFAVSPLLMPGIAEIAGAFFEGLLSGELPARAAISLLFIGVGMAIAWTLVFVGVLLGATVPIVGDVLDRLSALFHPLPGIALLPVVVLWFGVGPAAALVVIVHSVFWPVLANTTAGYRAIPETWRLLARNLELRGVTYLTRVAIPAMSPYLIAALRIAWARSWRALISAEMVFGAVAAGGGMGWYIFSQRVFMDTTGLFAGILFVMVIGSLVEHVVLRRVEEATVERWGMST